MSDFLQRLVERHVSPPVVRPRATSRFEPMPAFAAASHAADVPPRANALATGRFSATEGEDGGRESVGPGLDARAHRPGSPDRPVAPSTARPHRSTGTAPLHGGLPPTLHVPLGAAPDDVVRPQVGLAPRRAAAAARVRAATPTPIETGPDRPGSQPLRVESSVRAARPPRQPLSSPAGLTQAPEPPAPEVVLVHIGRVEVRAVVPPPERRREPPPAPRDTRPLSLDRYLTEKRRP